MAETHTIGTGKDYTTLQAAETAQNGDLSGRGVVTFECYSGSNLGSITVSGWSNEDATNYLEIRVPKAERHNGKIEDTGAYMEFGGGIGVNVLATDYTRVEGLRIKVTSASTGISLGNNPDNCLVDSNLIYWTGTNAAVGGIRCACTVSISMILRNNIISYNGKAATSPTKAIDIAFSSFSGSHTLDVDCHNNTIHGSSGSTAGYGLTFGATLVGATLTLNADIANNHVTDSDTEDYRDTLGATTVNWSGGNNLSSDATGDDWIATGAQINKSSGDEYYSAPTDLRLKTGADGIDNGQTIAAFDWDAITEDADNTRPDGSSWDIGALEGDAGVPPVTGNWWDNMLYSRSRYYG